MSSVKVWDRSGGLVFSGTSDDVHNGTIDYLGGSHYLICSDSQIQLVNIDLDSINLVKTLYSFPANEDGLGVAINHSRQQWDDSWSQYGFDGHQCYIAKKSGIDVIAYDFWLFDYITGNLVKKVRALGSSVPSGLGWDGHALLSHVSGESSGVRMYDITTGTAFLVDYYTSNHIPRDFAFDDNMFWDIGGLNIRLQPRKNWNQALKFFNHGHANASGLTFNGMNLISVGQ